jgi:hypothetical protein
MGEQSPAATVVEAAFNLDLQFRGHALQCFQNAVTQRPELAHITEDSNPVVILYSFKEGL